jgi:ParB-like chromosome segregation protein Spo0J
MLLEEDTVDCHQQRDDACATTVRFVPVHHLLTSYAPLRPGALRGHLDQTAQLPLRVVPAEGGAYEVIDGFKRLSQWSEQGHQQVPVVVEQPAESVQYKRLMLVANNPRRTLTALDEARVVCSLLDDDQQTETQIARLLGRKPNWVTRRIDIGRYLSPAAERQLATGVIGPTVAHSLCALPHKEQELLLAASERHGLTAQQTIKLISAYRLADNTDRRMLLTDPNGTLNPDPPPTVSPVAAALEQRLEHIRLALEELAQLTIPDELGPAEQRRIEALWHATCDQLHQTALALGHGPTDTKEKTDVERQQRRPTTTEAPPSACRRRAKADSRRDRRAAPAGLRNTPDRKACRLVAQDGPQHPCRAQKTQATCPEQARALSGGHRGQGQKGPHYLQNPTRDQGDWLPGRKDHPGYIRPRAPSTLRPEAEKEGEATF